MTEEVHVVCPHGQIAKFIASGNGAWIIRAAGAKRVTYPDGVVRWHHTMRCDQCRLTVPVVNPNTYSPILDRLVDVDSPAVVRKSSTVVEVSLKLMADILGAPRSLREKSR